MAPRQDRRGEDEAILAAIREVRAERALPPYGEEEKEEISTATFRIGKGEGSLRMTFDTRTRKVIGYSVAASMLLASVASLVWSLLPLFR